LCLAESARMHEEMSASIRMFPRERAIRGMSGSVARVPARQTDRVLQIPDRGTPLLRLRRPGRMGMAVDVQAGQVVATSDLGQFIADDPVAFQVWRSYLSWEEPSGWHDADLADAFPRFPNL
jgi:hypothetical protein